MKTKALSLALCTLVSLAACTKSATTEPATPTPAAAVAPTPAACPDPGATAGYLPFPQGVSPGFAYHLRDDRIYAHKSGKTRRRVAVEILGVEPQAALAAISQSLTQAGYRVGESKPGQEGRLTIPVYKKGAPGTMQLSFNPSAGPKPRNPEAKGVITLDYALPAKASAATAG